MAIVITKQFPGEIAPRTTAYVKHAGSVLWGGKTRNQKMIFVEVFRDEAHRQAEGIEGVEDSKVIPESSDNEEIQLLIDEHNDLINQLKANEYALLKLLEPVKYGSGEDLL